MLDDRWLYLGVIDTYDHYLNAGWTVKLLKQHGAVRVKEKKLMHRFMDLPKGTRFKYPDSDKVWIAIEGYKRGLIAEEIKPEDIHENNSSRQSLCSFVDADEGWKLESKVEVLP